MVDRRSARAGSAGSGVVQAILVTFLFFFAAIGAIGYLLNVTADRENSAAVAGQVHLAETALRGLQDEMSNRLVDYAKWDDIALQFDGTIDNDWAADNIGSYLQEQFGHTGTYGLNANLETQYRSTVDEEMPLDAQKFLGDSADAFLMTIKESSIAEPEPFHTYLEHDGKIYLVVGSLITYEELDEYPMAQAPRPILIFYRELNSELMTRISKQFLLEGLKLSPVNDSSAHVALKNISNKTIHWMCWQPDRPGDALLSDLFPKISAVTVALAVAALLVFVMWSRSVSAANEAKAQFLAKMSHELRTPLNPIIGFAEIIMSQLRGPVPESYREYAADIHRSAKHLQGIIGDVLDFAKVESGELVLRETTVDIGDLIRRLPAVTSSAWDSGSPACEQTKLPVRYEIAEGLPEVRIDELRIRQVFINLLSNAAKFSNGAEVVIRAYRDNTGLCVEVEDSGIGISKQDIERVFSPFVQAEISGGKSAKSSGTGLGLSVSRELMRLHGGDLILKSAPGAGTTACVCFPANRLV